MTRQGIINKTIVGDEKNTDEEHIDEKNKLEINLNINLIGKQNNQIALGNFFCLFQI